ncbi:unnamed protein product [Alternaria alternata]
MPWHNVPGHEIKSETGETLLHDSVKRDAVSVVKVLLANPHLQIDARNEHGFTALHYACQFASDDCITLLLTHGADIEKKSQKPAPGYTALGLAIVSRRTDLIIKLLNLGADLWLGNHMDSGPTFLHLVVAPELVLQRAHSDRSGQNFLEGVGSLPQNASILEDLVEEQQLEDKFEEIQEDLPLVNARHAHLGTALHLAIENGALDTVTVLLELGADSLITNQHQHTPLESFTNAYTELTCENKRPCRELQLFMEEISQVLKG